AIGGPFTLADQTGRTVHDTDYRGRMMLISFGYTTCPDVCPTTLASISQALDDLGADAERVQPLFITIDPARDTPEALAAYMPNFHPSLIGLTGTQAQIAAVAKAYKVYYAKAGGAAEGEDYLMDHSTMVYLMGPDGRLLTYLPNAMDPDALAARIREYL
ncbi:MAG: SCO family protein, partial [Kiloniellaceae bacterium]